MSATVKVEIREYPDDTESDYQTMFLHSHWNRKDRVVLRIETDKEYVFIMADLRAALNAIEAVK